MKWLLVLLTAFSLLAWKPQQTKLYGVGFVPKANGQGDVTEDMLFRFVGEIDAVDQMFVINDSVHLLETLLKLKNMGRKLDALVLAGHGSRETPGFKWGNEEMIPEDLNLAYNKSVLASAKALLADPERVRKSKPKYIEYLIKKEIPEAEARIRLIPQLSGIMAPNASILLINCSAAATPKGRAFVQALGNLLLTNGGSITASQTDIVLREVEDIYDQIGQFLGNGGVKEWGKPLIRGDWVSWYIPRAADRGSASSSKKPTPKPALKPAAKPKAPVKAKGSFGLVQKIFGRIPPPAEWPEGRISGTMSENQFSITCENRGPYEGTMTIAHNYKRGNLGTVLRPGEIIELQVVSIAGENGRDKHNVGSGGSWVIEGSAEVLEKGKTFAGRASDGRFYPASSARVRFRVGTGGMIKITAVQGGQLWGSTDNWNPVTYIYKYNAAPTERLGVGQ